MKRDDKINANDLPILPLAVNASNIGLTLGNYGLTNHNNYTLPASYNYNITSGTLSATQIHAGSMGSAKLQAASPIVKNNGQNKMSTKWKYIPIEPADSYEDQQGVHESPFNGVAAYIASLSYTNITKHHWMVFFAVHPEINYLRVGFFCDENANSTVATNVAFATMDDLHFFDTWLEKYGAVFGSKEALYNHRLPPVPSTMASTNCIKFYDGDQVKMSVWIFQHCVAPVYTCGNMLFFESDEDAFAYKLKFSK